MTKGPHARSPSSSAGRGLRGCLWLLSRSQMSGPDNGLRTGLGEALFEGRGLESREARKRRGRYVAAPPPQPRVGNVWRHPFWLRGAHRSSHSRAPASSHEPLQFPGPLARAVHPANSSADAPTPSSPPWGCPCLHGTALSRAHPTQGPP